MTQVHSIEKLVKINMHSTWVIHDVSKMIIYGTIFLVCTDMTTTEPQGTGRKRGRSDSEGADSEPGKYQLINFSSSSPTFTNIVIVSRVH